MRTLPFTLLLLACGPSTTVIGGDDDDGSGDTADTGTDTDTGADTDSGGGDTDTGPAPEPVEGDYEGGITGTMGSDEWAQTCEGSLEMSIDGDGMVEGAADCAFDGGGGWGDWAFEGDLTGEVVDGELTAFWSVDMGWGEPYDVEVTGTVEDGLATLELYADLGRMGEFLGEGEAEKQ